MTELGASLQDGLVQVVARKIVSIKYYNPIAFGQGEVEAGSASGFIVDSKNGLIMTNRVPTPSNYDVNIG